jgi:hypothetical protein
MATYQEKQLKLLGQLERAIKAREQAERRLLSTKRWVKKVQFDLRQLEGQPAVPTITPAGD